MDAALADPAFTARLADLGAPAYASSREDFAKVIAADTAKWAKVVAFANIKAE